MACKPCTPLFHGNPLLHSPRLQRRTCICVLIVSAGWLVTVANTPAVTPDSTSASPGVPCSAGCSLNFWRSSGATPKYPAVYSDSRIAVADCG